MVVGELAHERDLIIIGGGPGGYNAAIRASQLGLAVTLIEKDQLGGVCLNYGCIPSKVLTYGAEKYVSSHDDAELGIESKGTHFNIETLQTYKIKTIANLREGVTSLIKANKIELLHGSAFFLSEDRIGVENGDQFEVFRFKHAIIAAGCSTKQPEGIIIDNKRILDSRSITNINIVPEKLVIYGHDYIALEMAMAYNAFGSEVMLILKHDEFDFDSSINRELKRLLKKYRIQIMRSTKINEAYAEEEEVSIILQNKTGTEKISASHIFVSNLETPNTDNLGIARIGVKTTKEGFIRVDDQCRTSIAKIFAVGDITEGPSLAVKAIKQGKTAAEIIAGIPAEADFRFLPKVVHTRPPIASVGLTEEGAISQGYSIEIGQFPLSSNGYAAIIGKKEGFIKLIFDKENHMLIGMHIIGDGAIELISSGILSLEMASRDEDLLFPTYPHPSMNEGILEAVEAIKNQAIHLSPKFKKGIQV
ncbi:dihydrolipoyl dehydrogenase [Bacillus sp. FJAT-49705]|uniref:Dihydrolipoyl dehydrogenase n=1 Tax=Cytobacillus citreus TaxID=2833586 RepID=A0ABS5NNL0_9BACI|nr:dihydrolipoyl dehydrogenase [Cytobacillus citreus]MBS4189392.1 dihydrolipoyl dehydrogenase [Cytobacillus citreus]